MTDIKVVPYTYGIDDISEGDNTLVGIEEMSITYVQPADTCSFSDEWQHITFTTQNGCAASKEDAEEEQCFYFNITIPSGEHWSVEDGEQLKALVDDFKKRIYLKNKEKCKK